MSAYFTGVFVICACLGILGLLSYNEKNLAERTALGVILLYTVLSPIAENIRNTDFGDLKFDTAGDGFLDSGYSETAEAALSEGICSAIAEEFSLSEDDIFVTLEGFDFAAMRCEKVCVLLSGKAVLSDYTAIRDFVLETEVGKCEIKVEIGG